jgi:CBS-domain-containing membrane protein
MVLVLGVGSLVFEIITGDSPYTSKILFIFWAVGISTILLIMNAIFFTAVCRSYKALKKLDEMKPDDRYFGVYLSLIIM